MGQKSTRFIRSPGLVSQELEDGLIIFEPNTDQVHHLNHTMAILYDLCDGSKSTSELARSVSDMFSLSEVPVEEVTASLDELVELGVLMVVPN